MAPAATSGSRLLCSKRLNLALLCFAGSAIAYALRSNLSFAIVCMVKEDSNGTAEAKSGCAREVEAIGGEGTTVQVELLLWNWS